MHWLKYTACLHLYTLHKSGEEFTTCSNSRPVSVRAWSSRAGVVEPCELLPPFSRAHQHSSAPTSRLPVGVPTCRANRIQASTRILSEALVVNLSKTSHSKQYRASAQRKERRIAGAYIQKVMHLKACSPPDSVLANADLTHSSCRPSTSESIHPSVSSRRVGLHRAQYTK